MDSAIEMDDVDKRRMKDDGSEGAPGWIKNNRYGSTFVSYRRLRTCKGDRRAAREWQETGKRGVTKVGREGKAGMSLLCRYRLHTPRRTNNPVKGEGQYANSTRADQKSVRVFLHVLLLGCPLFLRISTRRAT